MRLIAADSIMRKMAGMLNESGNPQLAEKAIALIDHEPTAFNKEEVIAFLKTAMESAQLAKLLAGAGLGPSGGFADGYYNGIKEVLEIVEKGGIK